MFFTSETAHVEQSELVDSQSVTISIYRKLPRWSYSLCAKVPDYDDLIFEGVTIQTHCFNINDDNVSLTDLMLPRQFAI